MSEPSGVMDWDMDLRVPALECDHCGFDAIERENGIFYDGEGDACMTCGFPGMVSGDSESPAEWVASDDPDALCEDAACTEDCVERRGQAGCGWAFDAGMREAERNRAQQCFVVQLREHKNDERAAVAAERERCAAIARKAERGNVQYGSGSRASLTIMVRARLDIESGAPAPREG